MRLPKNTMIAYSCFFILLAGFYYLTFKNSPKHATILLLVVAVSIGIGFIQPREKFTLLALALGIIGVFVVIVQSRKAREKTLQKWLADNGFRRMEFQAADGLFKPTNDTVIRINSYIGDVIDHQQNIPFLMAVRHRSSPSGKTSTILVDCSYYFKGQMNIDTLEQKFKIAKENTPHTNLWKSSLGYFDLKDCEIFKPVMGGIAVNWRVPDAIDGYRDRHEWIKNALKK